MALAISLKSFCISTKRWINFAIASNIKVKIAVSSRPPNRKLIEAGRVVAIIPRRIELMMPIATTTQAKTLVQEEIRSRD